MKDFWKEAEENGADEDKANEAERKINKAEFYGYNNDARVDRR